MGDGFKNSCVLIVGGAGFVGSNLSELLLKQEDIAELWIVDNLISSDICNIPSDQRVKFIYGSITDERVLKQLPRHVNYVFHLACYHGNQSSIADPIADHDNNLYTSLKLFDLIKDFKDIKKVVYAAAGCAVAEKTFDSAKPTLEDAPLSLFHDSPYSISKLVGEMYGNYYFSQYKMPFVKARFQNVYGPKEILGAGRWRGTVHTVWRNVIPTFVWKALHSEALPLDNGGQNSRDFIFVNDIVRGLLACALYGNAGEAYNLASGKEMTIAELAELINRFTGNQQPVNLLPARNWDHSGRRFGSVEKSKDKLFFSANIDIEEGIRRTIEWTIENQNMIEQNIKNHVLFMGNY